MLQQKTPGRTHADGSPLTPEQLQYAPSDLSDIALDPKPRMTPYGEQDDNGVDVSLIRSILKRSPLERALDNFRGAQELLEMRRNARRRWQTGTTGRAGRSAAGGPQ